MSSNSFHFHGQTFLPTRFASADEKAAFANNLMRFIETGCRSQDFTQHLYNRLSMTFGFIAHYDRRGFSDTYFTTAEDKMRFLRKIVSHPCYGDPKYTFSDVEWAIREHIVASNLLSLFDAAARAEQEAPSVGSFPAEAPSAESTTQLAMF